LPAGQQTAGGLPARSRAGFSFSWGLISVAFGDKLLAKTHLFFSLFRFSVIGKMKKLTQPTPALEVAFLLKGSADYLYGKLPSHQ